MSVAGAARAAEGELDFRARRAGIDVENAGGDITHSALHAVDILGVDRAGQPVFCIVVDGDGFLK